ncbi:MAG TPA: hypothetical protein PLD54_04780 [Candidatus Levybacteria bacterium]|nr:hypothetical protein [Candidatus Levybacteria bacterium]
MDELLGRVAVILPSGLGLVGEIPGQITVKPWKELPVKVRHLKTSGKMSIRGSEYLNGVLIIGSAVEVGSLEVPKNRKAVLEQLPHEVKLVIQEAEHASKNKVNRHDPEFWAELKNK